MDRIDRQILEILQTDGNISNQDLADKVGLSPSPCLRRVKQLEEDGYIKNYVALINPEKIGLTLTIIIMLGLTSHDPKKMQLFEKTVSSYPEVINCYLIAGQTADYMLKVIVANLNDYQDFLLKKITRIDGVGTVHSSFVLNKIVEKTSLPLNHLK
ncbi:MAG: Lrp/AsnC family transcriptional regulator [Gammaproteobacteria bacterium]